MNSKPVNRKETHANRIEVVSLMDENENVRPRDCEDGIRPCPYKECRYHLSTLAGETCAVDVAERGPQTLRAVGELLGISNVAVLKIERRALAKLRLARG